MKMMAGGKEIYEVKGAIELDLVRNCGDDFLFQYGIDIYLNMSNGLKKVITNMIGFRDEELDSRELDEVIEGCDIRESNLDIGQVWTLYKGPKPVLHWVFTCIAVVDDPVDAIGGSHLSKYEYFGSQRRVTLRAYLMSDLYYFNESPNHQYAIYPACPSDHLELHKVNLPFNVDSTRLFSPDYIPKMRGNK